MNIVNSGSRFQVYGEDVHTYRELPVASYNVTFSKMTGFYLTERNDLQVTEQKIYGSSEYKVGKVMQSYKLAQRNFGVLLSGQKGIGKSLFVRLLARQAINDGIPVIVVSKAIPGIEDFLASIDQDCVVVFDEFEKTFAKVDDWNPQDDLLSLFDGTDGGHKLFVVTCNDANRISEYMLNRPGRFHYHFTLGAPNDDEIREYLRDTVDPKYADVIEDIVRLSITVDLPYDYLRAIAFELNQGYDIKEVMSDLNITKTNNMRYDVSVVTQSGTVYEAWGERINLADHGRGYYISVYNNKVRRGFTTYIYPECAKLVDGRLVIADRLDKPYFDESDFRDLPENQRAAAVDAANADTIKYIVLTKCPEASVERLKV